MSRALVSACKRRGPAICSYRQFSMFLQRFKRHFDLRAAALRSRCPVVPAWEARQRSQASPGAAETAPATAIFRILAAGGRAPSWASPPQLAAGAWPQVGHLRCWPANQALRLGSPRWERRQLLAEHSKSADRRRCSPQGFSPHRSAPDGWRASLRRRPWPRRRGRTMCAWTISFRDCARCGRQRKGSGERKRKGVEACRPSKWGGT
jgi:hypothetical protein